MHIVIPIEIENREFDAKTWLGGMLAADGHEITLGQNKIINENLENLKPDLYIGLSAVDRARRRERFQTLRDLGASIFVLDTEGGAFGSSESFVNRVSPEILKHVDVYLAWGEQSAKVARDSVNKHDLSTDVVATGNPRFDLLHPDMTSLYEEETNRIQNDHGDFILFNTNFSVNHIDLESNRSSALQDMQETYKVQSRLLAEFVSLIYELDQQLDQYNIVVRPHPGENPETYRALLAPYDQVTVTKSGEIRPWILASDLVIHNSCTTGLETGLMRQPVLSYFTQFHDDHTSNNIGYTANNPAEVIDCIQRLDEHTTANSDLDYLQQFIANTEKKAATRIRETIHGDTRDDGADSSVSDSSSVNEILGKYIYKLNPSVYRLIRNSDRTPEYWTYTSYKCGYLPIDELRRNLNQFSEWYDRPVSVERYGHTDNLFHIRSTAG